MAGPLRPQSVTRRGPQPRNFVPGMDTVASSTTVPIISFRAGSSIFMLKREGTGLTISRSSPENNACHPLPVHPPVVTRTESKVSPALPDIIFQPFWPCSRPLTRAFVLTFTPDSRIALMRTLTISIASCEAGKTHWSSCTTSLTPISSNHLQVSSWPKRLNSFFIRLAPRG